MTEKWCTAASNASDFISKVFKPREELFVYDQTSKIGYPLGERRVIKSLSDLEMSKDTSHPPKSESLLATTRGAFSVSISCTTCRDLRASSSFLTQRERNSRLQGPPRPPLEHQIQVPKLTFHMEFRDLLYTSMRKEVLESIGFSIVQNNYDESSGLPNGTGTNTPQTHRLEKFLW